MTDRRLKLFPRDEAGNIIRRPLYAHFLLRASRTERGMKILFQPAMLNGALEFSQKSDDYVGVPIQIKALADTTQTAGEKLVLFQRVTAEATS